MQYEGEGGEFNMSGASKLFGGFAALGIGAALRSSKSPKPIYIRAPYGGSYKAKTKLMLPVNTAERNFFIKKVDSFLFDDYDFIDAMKKSPYDGEVYCKLYANKLLDPWRETLINDWDFKELEDDEYYDFLIEYLKPCEPQWSQASNLKTYALSPSPISIVDKDYIKKFVENSRIKHSTDAEVRFGENACINTSRLARCISDMLDIENGYFPFFVRGCGLEHWQDIISPFNFIMALYDQKIKALKKLGREIDVPHEFKDRLFKFESRFDIEVEYTYDARGTTFMCNMYQKIFEAINPHGYVFRNGKSTDNAPYDPYDTEEKDIHIWEKCYDKLPPEFHYASKPKMEPKPFTFE